MPRTPKPKEPKPIIPRLSTNYSDYRKCVHYQLWKFDLVFITKYALTKGIREVEAEINESLYNKEGYIRLKGEYISYYIGRDCFLDEQTAIAKAEDMRKKKIESLRKQIKKIENIKFK